MSENTPVGFEVISVITAELSAKVSRGQATPSASHSAASSRKMYLHAIREGIRMPSECNQGGNQTQSECNQGGSPTQSDALIEVSLKSFVGEVDEQLLE